MKAVIYSKDFCPYCEDAKILLKAKNIEYTEYVVGVDISRDDFLKKIPNAKTVPQIYLDEEYIGGYDNLSARFLQVP